MRAFVWWTTAFWLAGAIGLASTRLAAAAEPFPAYYPNDYRGIVEEARREGRVVVYGAADIAVVNALIRDFESLYPGVSIDYRELNSAELYERFVGEVTAQRASADVLWSAAMDLQAKLANDNLAAAYRSPEASHLPEWAVWRDMAYGTTFEPAVFVYNRRLVPADEIPQTHTAMLKLLQDRRERYNGKVTTFDIGKSAVGFLFATQDARLLPSYWELVRELGRAAVQFEPETSGMVERIASGRAYLGYNLIGSYALARARRDPAIGVVLPSDYTLVLSRIAVLARSARHPNAGKLWLDYLLSRRGQRLLAERAEMPSIRTDVEGDGTSARLREKLGPSLKAIAVGPALLVYRDRAKQVEFLRRWRGETQP